MANRKGIPVKLKDVSQREANSTEIYWEKNGDLVLGSYVVNTKSKQKKNVMMLSTLRPILGTTIDDKKDKPALYKLYDFTKGGTDIVDQRMAFYTSKVKSRKWSMVAFSYVLDMARVNSSTLFALNQKIYPLKQNSFEYEMEVDFELIKPFIIQRNQSRLSAVVKSKMTLTFSLMNVENPARATRFDNNQNLLPAKSAKRGRCKICISELIPGVHQMSLSSGKAACQLCGNHVCAKHNIQVCAGCYDDNK